MSKKHKKQVHPDYLLMRYGGLGDTLFVTSVAHVLSKQGMKVTVIGPKSHAPLWERNSDATFVPATRRSAYANSSAGPVNLIETEDGHMIPAESLYHEFVDYEKYPERPLRAVDYFQVIENNTQRPHMYSTQNSDYVNAYDMHLAWAGIDPTTVPDGMKRPVYHVSQEERAWAKDTIKSLPKPVVLIQPHASSPARTYMRGAKLAKQIKKGHNSTILWSAEKKLWQFMHSDLIIPEEINPLRATAALVEAADLVISVDTFISHLAEALCTTHITLYSTVPAWTRSKYYQHEITVNAVDVFGDRPCYCHVITNGRCPRREKQVIDEMSDLDRYMLAILPVNIKQQLSIPPSIVPPEGYKPPSMLPGQMQARQQAAATNWNTDRHAEGLCISSVDLLDYFKAWKKDWKGGQK